MNQSWSKYKLNELASLKTGKLDSNAAVPDGKYPYFTCATKTYAIDSYSFDTTAILLAGNNATGVFPIKFYSGKFNCYQRTYVIESINPKECDLKFLYFSLQVQLKFLQNLSIGAATKFLTKRLLDNLKIPLPPLPTQQKIAQILSAYDDLIENNLKRIKLLEEMAQITYEQWFVRMKFPKYETTPIDAETGLPEGWRIKPFSLLADFLNGYAFKPAQLGDIGLPVIKIKELKGGVINSTPRNLGDVIPDKYTVLNGDILFSWSGSLEVELWQHDEGLLNQHLFKVTPLNETPDSFLYLALKAALPIFNNLTTGATMKHIKRKELDFVKTKYPDESILKLFDEIVKPILTYILNLNKQNQNLKEARDILLPRLMTGMIDVDKIKLPAPNAVSTELESA